MFIIQYYYTYKYSALPYGRSGVCLCKCNAHCYYLYLLRNLLHMLLHNVIIYTYSALPCGSSGVCWCMYIAHCISWYVY